MGIPEEAAQRRRADDHGALRFPLRQRFSTGYNGTLAVRPNFPKARSGIPAAALRIRRIHGPDGTSYGASIDRTGTRLATAGSDGQVKVWNVVLGRLDHAFRAHDGWASDVAFSPDGSRLASTGQDDKVRIWTLAPNPTPGQRESGAGARSLPANAAESSASPGAPTASGSRPPVRTGPFASGIYRIAAPGTR